MESTTINYDRVPSHMQSGVRRYVEQGIPPGGFLRAVLSDSLTEAYHRADATNQAHIGTWVDFVYNELPSSCWGSPEAVDKWVDQGGLEGL